MTLFCISRHRSGETEGRERRAWNGFTLIEIVIALTIVAVITAAAIPSVRGMMHEREAREPVIELVRLAKSARLRAMKEKRPYQVAITQQGFTASRYFDPYLTTADLTDFLALSDQAEQAGVPDEDILDPTSAPADPASSGKVAEAAPSGLGTGQAAAPKVEWNERYALKAGTTLSTQFWHESLPMPLEGDAVRLWVFQPNGMCEPIKISMAHESASFTVEFSALTADVVREVSDLK